MKQLLFAWLALFANLSLQASQSFKIKPYLYSHRGERIALAWTSSAVDQSSQFKAEFFQAGKVIGHPKIEKDGDLNFVFLPLQCGWGNGFSYKITGMKEAQPIVNLPCPSGFGKVRFAFVTDSQQHYNITSQFADRIAKSDFSFLIHGGDLVHNGGEDDEWTQVFQALDPILKSRPMVSAVGNHEYIEDPDTSNWSHFFQYKASEAYYVFQSGPVRIFVINSNFFKIPGLVEREAEWLDHVLREDAHWKIVVFHHPPYSVGIANNAFAPRKEYREVQDHLVPLFEKYKVDLVLNGHTHVFERSMKGGVVYLTGGAMGGKMGFAPEKNIYSVLSAKSRSWTLLEADAHSLRAISEDLAGKVLDQFILKK